MTNVWKQMTSLVGLGHKRNPHASSPTQPRFSTSPELMCGIAPGMKKSETRAHLAMLFRRFNGTSASLDENRRREAEMMLEAIAICRQRYVDERE